MSGGMWTILVAVLVLPGRARLGGAVKEHQYIRSEQSGATGIVNGSIVQDPSGTFSYFALPAHHKGNRWLGCGASIISPTFGLSSAHCFGGGLEPCKGPEKLSLWVGDLRLNDFEISTAPGGKSARLDGELICNPAFNGKCSNGHDIALVKFSTPLPSWVKPVPLDLKTSGQDSTVADMTVGNPLTIMGYGNAETPDNKSIVGDASERLRKATVKVQDDSVATCQKVYAGGYGCSDEHSEGPASNIGHQFCGGVTDNTYQDTCAGDSGGPLVSEGGVQVGIVSYGGGPGSAKFGPGRECGDPDWPGIYARISGLTSFIQEHVKDLPGASPSQTVLAKK